MSTAAADPPKLIPLRAMARRLGVPATWLRAEVDAGRVPALVAGRAYVCDPEAVERALLDRARQTKPSREGQEVQRAP
jgi:hypothetical protein